MHHIAFDSPNTAGPASPGFATIQVSSWLLLLLLLLCCWKGETTYLQKQCKLFCVFMPVPTTCCCLLLLPLQLLILLLKCYVYSHHYLSSISTSTTMHHIAFDSPNIAVPASPGSATCTIQLPRWLLLRLLLLGCWKELQHIISQCHTTLHHCSMLLSNKCILHS